jgi:predicted lipid-binding transport protein (Tim44 family)
MEIFSHYAFWILTVLILVGIGMFLFFYQKKQKEQQLVEAALLAREAGVAQKQLLENYLMILRGKDPHFSRISFLDFVKNLYLKYHLFQGEKYFIQLRPFLSDFLLQEELDKIKTGLKYKHVQVSITALHITAIETSKQKDSVVVEIEAAYTRYQTQPPHLEQDCVKRERWTLERKAEVKSLSADFLQELLCPYCKKTGLFDEKGVCTYCETEVVAGEGQWFLADREAIFEAPIKPDVFVNFATAYGLQIPTLVHPQISDQKAKFLTRHQISRWESYWQSYQERIILPYFEQVYEAWRTYEWGNARHLVGDRLYEVSQFWLKSYQKRGIESQLLDPQISKIELAKIEMDAYYEVLTARIFISCFEFVSTLKEQKVLKGSKTKRHYFSEYWTFVRKHGVHANSQKDLDYDIKTCPNCRKNADKMGKNAQCGYCGQKVNLGDYFWVLQNIEQDETYIG